MSAPSPLFSIITVCFNSSATIKRTIESILAQDFTDYEYIIVDGGSTDGTVDIIRSYEAPFGGRLEWTSEKDNGIYDAFNKGCMKASGKYIWIVNSDDFIEPDALCRLRGIIQSFGGGPLPIIACGARECTPEGISINEFAIKPGEVAWLLSIDSIPFVHPATLIPNDVYREFGYYDTGYKIMADLDWGRMITGKPVEIRYFDFMITNMTMGGISTRINLKANIKDRRRYFKKFYASSRSEQYSRMLKWLFRYSKGWIKKALGI